MASVDDDKENMMQVEEVDIFVARPVNAKSRGALGAHTLPTHSL